jgi:transcriptional regulator with XRE-family HTH domain
MPPHRQVGPLLRSWRERRRRSQLDLALDTGISARHLSFVETGRSRPSAGLVLRLAEQLEVPLRERNALLLAAGFAPAYEERPLDAPEMQGVRDAVQHVLDGHEPYPAAVVDRGWNLVAANRGIALLAAGATARLLEPPVNVVRLSLHPDGAAPRIVNLAEWRAHMLDRLERELALTGDPRLRELLDEVRDYPAPVAAGRPNELVVPLHIHTTAGELRLISTVTIFGTAVDITVAELTIESFFPADQETAAALRRSV